MRNCRDKATAISAAACDRSPRDGCTRSTRGTCGCVARRPTPKIGQSRFSSTSSAASSATSRYLRLPSEDIGQLRPRAEHRLACPERAEGKAVASLRAGETPKSKELLVRQPLRADHDHDVLAPQWAVDQKRGEVELDVAVQPFGNGVDMHTRRKSQGVELADEDREILDILRPRAAGLTTEHCPRPPSFRSGRAPAP